MRMIHVISRDANGRESIIAVREAASLRKGLEAYYKETLQPRGCTEPVFAGNIMSVQDGVVHREYLAKEAK